MIVNSPNRTVITNSSDRRSSFGIDITTHSFKVLSDSLYQYKIPAIIRELSANAYDSHVQAGKEDVPFVVSLPNRFNPFFTIEDFGIGLDDEDVRTVCTIYFKSTKQMSNDVVGCFGLGMKTPMSYTDTYSIRARKDGIERFYTVFINEEGLPDIDILSESPTTESDGVMISMPVEEKDFATFKTEAEFILSFFKVKPTVIADDFLFVFDDIVNELDADGIVAKNIRLNSMMYNTKAFIVMGTVCYPLSVSNLYDMLEEPEKKFLNNVLVKNYESRLFIKFDIGELGVAASRESLSIDDKTNAKLKEKCQEKIHALRKIDQEKVDEFSNPVNALDYIQKKYNLGELGWSMFTFKGESLHKYAHLDFNIKNVVPYVFYTNSIGRKSICKRDYLTYGALAGNDINAIVIDTKKTTGSIKAIKEIMESSKTNCVGLIIDGNPSDLRITRLERLFGKSIKCTKFSDILAKKPKPQKVPNTTKYKANPKNVVSCHHFYDSTSNISYGKVDLSDKTREYYYFDYLNSFKYSFQTNGQVMYFDDVAKLAKELGYKAVFIRKDGRSEKKLDAHNVEHIDVFLKKAISEISENLTYLFVSYRIPGTLNINDSGNLEFSDYLSTLVYEQNYFGVANDLINYCDEYSWLNYNNMHRFNRFMNDKFSKEADVIVEKFDKGRQCLVETYPLLNHISNVNNLSEESMNHIKIYMEAIDTVYEHATQPKLAVV